MADKTPDTIEEKVDSPRVQPGKLPEPFVKSLDGSTLSGLEERTHSPHLQQTPVAPLAAEPIDYHKVAQEQIAKSLADKTLDDIEHKIDSPHLDAKPPADPSPPPPVVIPPVDESTKDDIQLAYEPHESEPPETTTDTATSESDAPNADDSSRPDATESPAKDSSKSSSPQDDTPQAESAKDDVPADDAKPAEPTDDSSTLSTAPNEAKKAEARDAVMEAIRAGGSDQDPLPALDAIGSAGLVEVGHQDQDQTSDATAPPDAPPPIAPSSPPQVSSPHIDTIDDTGTINFKQNLVPTSEELPADATAAPEGEAGAAPPVPPPMMPTAPADDASTS
jgi:hypothetical protein